MPKKFATLGCCGLDCGLCPRYHAEGTSRCPGCGGDGFEDKHPSCSFITCCVKKKNLEVCAECDDFPCMKFDKETGETDSFITHRRVMLNQNFIREHGITVFIQQQNERMCVLKKMLQLYDDGRSKSLYCLATTLLTLKSLNEAIIRVEAKIKEKSIDQDDIKSKARTLKEILDRFAEAEKEELRLRKG